MAMGNSRGLFARIAKRTRNFPSPCRTARRKLGEANSGKCGTSIRRNSPASQRQGASRRTHRSRSRRESSQHDCRSPRVRHPPQSVPTRSATARPRFDEWHCCEACKRVVDFVDMYFGFRPLGRFGQAQHPVDNAPQALSGSSPADFGPCAAARLEDLLMGFII